MGQYLDELDFSQPLSKMDLLKILKKEASNIHIKEIMDASVYLKEDAKFMPPKEREEFIKRFTQAFFIRIKDLKDDKSEYHGWVNTAKLQDFFQVLDRQREQSHCHEELCFQKIAKIIATYTAFIKKESIHPVGTQFPGGFVLRCENRVYYCPVKEKQLNTPGALCRFCVSVQDETV